MRFTNFRFLVLGVLCAGLLCLFPRSTLSIGFGMASSVKKAVTQLDGNVSSQQASATTSVAAKSGVLAILPAYGGAGTTNVMDFRTGATSCPGALTNCDLYFTGGYFTSYAAANGGGLSSGWIADVGPVSGPSAIASYPGSGHEAQSVAVAGHGYVMMLGDSTYAALYAMSVPVPSSGTAPTYAPVYFSWIYPFQPSSLGQSWLLTVVTTGTSAGTVTSVPSGINCTSGGSGSGCSAEFPSGTLVTLTPKAVSGSFLGWSGAGPCAGGTGNCIFTGKQDLNLTAQFGYIGLAVSNAGTGTGTVVSSPAGINCGTTCAETFTATATVTLTAAPGADSTFTSWSGACAGQGATCVLSVTAAGLTATTANFAGNQILVVLTDTGTGNVTSAPAGINCGVLNGVVGGLCQANFPVNTTVTLTATPSATSLFNGWSGAGGCAGTGACAIVTNGHAFPVTADFHMPLLTVNETVASGSSGTVTSNLAGPSGFGINCMPVGPGGYCGPVAYDLGTNITLTATAYAAGSLVTWNGASPSACETAAAGNTSACSFSVTQDTAATAVIKRGGVIVTVVGSSSGTVTGGGLNCGNGNTVCSVAVTPTGADNITLTATQNVGLSTSSFQGWTSGVGNWVFASTTSFTDQTATSDAQIQTITATFQ